MDSDFYRIFNKLLKLKIVNGFRISNGFRVQTDFGFRAEFLLRILTDFGFSKVKRILFLETFLNIALLFPQLLYMQVLSFCSTTTAATWISVFVFFFFNTPSVLVLYLFDYMSDDQNLKSILNFRYFYNKIIYEYKRTHR